MGGFDVVLELHVGEELLGAEIALVVSLPQMNDFHVDAELRGCGERLSAIRTNMPFDILVLDQVVRRDHALEGERLAAFWTGEGLQLLMDGRHVFPERGAVSEDELAYVARQMNFFPVDQSFLSGRERFVTNETSENDAFAFVRRFALGNAFVQRVEFWPRL